MDQEDGRVAQLGEHLLCKQGVAGSIPATSTNLRPLARFGSAGLGVATCFRLFGHKFEQSNLPEQFALRARISLLALMFRCGEIFRMGAIQTWH